MKAKVKPLKFTPKQKQLLQKSIENKTFIFQHLSKGGSFKKLKEMGFEFIAAI